MPLLQYLAERISSIPMTMPDTGSGKSWTVLSPRCAMLVTCLIIPGASEPSVRTLRATIPENESQPNFLILV